MEEVRPRRRMGDQIEGTDWGERLGRLEAQMNTALEGVGNFREFQRRANEFFEYARAQFNEQRIRDEEKAHYQEAVARSLELREKNSDRRWRRILTWILIIGGLITLSQYMVPTVRRALGLPIAASSVPKADNDIHIPHLALIPNISQ